jgi:TonB family protein
MTSVWRLSAALVLSLGLHAALGAVVSTKAQRVAAVPQDATERIEVEVEGASVRARQVVAGADASPVRATRALAAHSRAHVVRQLEPRRPTVVSAALAPQAPQAPGEKGDLPLAGALPGSSDVPEAPSTEPVGGGGDGASEGSAPSAGPDIGVFVERLRRSAQRCSLRRGAPGTEAALARVRFCVDAQGMPQAVSLLQSTGDPRLDRDALECVVPGAAPLPASDRCLVVPLRFSL